MKKSTEEIFAVIFRTPIHKQSPFKATCGLKTYRTVCKQRGAYKWGFALQKMCVDLGLGHKG